MKFGILLFKKGNSVSVLSIMHPDKAINKATGDEVKPDMTTFHMIKVGDNFVDQLWQKSYVT